MKRYELPQTLRFITFSTYLRLPLFRNDAIKDRFLEHLALNRRDHGFHLYGWVVMPEHVHLLVWPRLPECPLSAAIHQLKLHFGREVIARWRELNAAILAKLEAPDGSTRFWQRGGGHDRNVDGEAEFTEKLNYIHQNPVQRGLVTEATKYRWSSAAWHAGERSGGLKADVLPPRRPGV
jgi:putative transposase